jgi:hypothetical protein
MNGLNDKTDKKHELIKRDVNLYRTTIILETPFILDFLKQMNFEKLTKTLKLVFLL